ncbi:MAG TPA: TadE/TadG family type IV pilus assembly protein [Thermomicrobiales bacterium]
MHAARLLPVARPSGGRSERGQSLVELAIGLPILLLLLLGTLDLGRVFFEYIELRNAVREGASYGARNPNDESGIRARVLQHGDSIASGTTVTITCAGNCSTAGSEGSITVTGTRTFKPIASSFLAMFGLGSIPISVSATAKVLS